jgi:hypothetical protein
MRTKGQLYPSDSWTDYTSDWWGGRVSNLESGMRMGDERAYMTMGMIRLLSAFSYLHLQFHQGTPVKSDVSVFRSGVDLIANLPPSSPLVIPINPRSSRFGGQYILNSMNSIAEAMKSKSSKLRKIEEIAKRDAERDAPDPVLAGQSLVDFLAYSETTPAALDTFSLRDVSAFQKMIEARGGLKLTDAKKAELDAAAADAAAADAAGTTAGGKDPAAIFKVVGLGLLALALLRK